jgi:hypothetical protein
MIGWKDIKMRINLDNLNKMSKHVEEIQKESITNSVEQTEEYKRITEETNRRIEKVHRRYARAYSNAKDYFKH